MSASVICLVCALAYILHLAQSQISPTNTNASGTFYIASDYNNSGAYFQYGSITCNGSYCHIVCDVAYGCQSLSVSATSPRTTLVVECLDQTWSCYQAVINANTANSVQLSCSYSGSSSNMGSHTSCYSLELQASNVQNDVSILCDGYYACVYAYFQTSSVGNSVTMVCDGHYACYMVHIFCPKDALCNINCASASGIACYYTSIYIETNNLADKLNLDCFYGTETSCYGGYFFCEEAEEADEFEDTERVTYLIFSNSTWDCSDYKCCPLRGNISCSSGELCEIDCDSQNCNNVIIDASSATSLSLYCGANGCKHAMIYCPFGSSASCNIQCHDLYSCEYVSINTDTNQMQQLFVACESLYSCQYLDLQLNSAQITEVTINCSSYQACKYMNLQFSGFEINNLQLICAGSQSCNSSTIKSAISHLYIVCTDSSSCSNMQLEAMISVNSNIYCGAQAACNSTDINLVSTKPGVNFNISCVSSSNLYDACKEANINIYGYNDGTKTNNVSYVCDTNDCSNATFNLYDVYWINVECNDLSACEYSLNATTSQHLAVRCSGYKGCYNTHVFCPIEGRCYFDCLGFDACTSMKVEITNNIYDELNVKCIDPYYGCDDGILISCVDSAQYGKLMWSSYYQSMVCYGVCCPPHLVQASDKVSYDTVNNTQSTNTENEYKTQNDDSAMIILSVVLVVIVVVAVIYFKRMNEKMKELHEFAENLQKNYNHNNNNNENIEMINSSNTNQLLEVIDPTAENIVAESNINETTPGAPVCINTELVMSGSAMKTRKQPVKQRVVGEENIDNVEIAQIFKPDQQERNASYVSMCVECGLIKTCQIWSTDGTFYCQECCDANNVLEECNDKPTDM